jgi:hypothetical protein
MGGSLRHSFLLSDDKELFIATYNKRQEKKYGTKANLISLEVLKQVNSFLLTYENKRFNKRLMEKHKKDFAFRSEEEIKKDVNDAKSRHGIRKKKNMERELARREKDKRVRNRKHQKSNWLEMRDTDMDAYYDRRNKQKKDKSRDKNPPNKKKIAHHERQHEKRRVRRLNKEKALAYNKRNYDPIVTESLDIPSVTSMFKLIGSNDELFTFIKEQSLGLLEQVRGLITTQQFNAIEEWITATGIFLYRTLTSSNYSEFAMSMYEYVRKVLPDFFKYIVAKLKALWPIIKAHSAPFLEKCSVYLEDGMSSAEVMLGVFKEIILSELFSSLRNILLSIVSMKWLGKDYALKLRSILGETKSGSTMYTLIIELMKVSVNLYTYGKAFLSGKSVLEIMRSTDPIMQFKHDSRKILEYEGLTYRGLPVQGKMEFGEYRRTLTELISVGNTLVETCKPLSANRKLVETSVTALTRALVVANNMAKAKSRTTPIGIVLYGAPGIGKSKLIKEFPKIYSKVVDRSYSDYQIFSICKTSEYMEGYDPVEHPYLHISELGNEHSNIAKMNGSPMLEKLNSIVDSLPMQADMAFEDKGKIYIDPDMVIVDTNNPTMHIDETMYCPPAMYRRFIWIHASVKPEFRAQGSLSLDSQKSLEYNANNEGDDILDRYVFTIYTYKVGDQMKQCKRSKETMESIDQLRHYISIKVTHRLEAEERVQRMVDTDEVKTESMDVENVTSVAVQFVQHARYLASGCTEYAYRLTSEMAIFSILWLIGVWKFSESEKSSKMFTVTRRRLFVTMVAGLFVMLAVKWTWLPYVLMLLGLPLIFVDTDYLITWLIAKGTKHFVSTTESRKKLAVERIWFLSGLGSFPNPFIASPGMKILAFSFPLLLIASIYYFKKKFEVTTQATSDFRDKDINNEILNKMEDKMDCTRGYVRVKTAEHAAWNVVQNCAKGAFKGEPKDMHFIRRNVRDCVISTKALNRQTRLLGVKGDYALLNTHALGDCLSGCVRISLGMSCKQGDTRDISFEPQDLVQWNDDLTLVRLRGMKFKDITMHFVDGVPGATLLGAIGNNTNIWVTKLAQEIQMGDRKLGKILIRNPWTYQIKHADGMCGEPVMGKVNSRDSAILGIHSGGSINTDNAFATPVTRGGLEKAIAKLNEQQREGLMAISNDGYVLESLDMPLPKSPFRYEELPHIYYKGKIPGPVIINHKSRLTRSCIAKKLNVFFMKHFRQLPDTTYGKPMMKPTTVQGEYLSPWNLGLRKMNKPLKSLDSQIMIKVVDLLVKRITKGIKRQALAPLTMESAINGVENDPFTRRINASTSGGYGFPGIKDKHIPLLYPEDVKREANSVCKERVTAVLRQLARNEMPNFIFNTQLKDEPRPLDKCISGKTRIFYMSPLDYLIVARMLLSPFYTLMVEHSDLFCTAVGINMHTGAPQFVEKLRKFSPLIMEGDYGGYDVSMPFDISLAAATVVERVLRAKGYNDSAMTLVRSLLSDNLFPNVNMNQDLFERPGMQPSGKYATAEDNSLKGLIMLMYAWYASPKTKDKDFFQHVLPVTYGDDVVVAIKESVSKHFNNVVYQDFVKEVYNMEFTNADKGAKMEPFLNVHSMSFLKRNFVYSEITKGWVARLALSSLYKALYWYLPSDAVSPVEQLTSTCASFLWEAYFWCNTETEFNNIREDLITLLVDSLEMTTSTQIRRVLPNFGDVHERIVGE